MSTRNFDPARDAPAALQHGWLYPGEQLDWTCARRRVEFEVKGRKKNGRPRAHLALRVLGWVLLSPLMLIFLIGAMFSDTTDINDWDDGGVRSVIVKGSRIDCLAARLAEVKAKWSFWVLTDRRFAFVTAEPIAGHENMVQLRTVWELTSEHYVYHPPSRGKWNQLGVSARVAFPDSSSITFLGVSGR